MAEPEESRNPSPRPPPRSGEGGRVGRIANPSYREALRPFLLPLSASGRGPGGGVESESCYRVLNDSSPRTNFRQDGPLGGSRRGRKPTPTTAHLSPVVRL